MKSQDLNCDEELPLTGEKASKGMQQSASMEEIASSSQALAKLAQDLQAAVNKFRI